MVVDALKSARAVALKGYEGSDIGGHAASQVGLTGVRSVKRITVQLLKSKKRGSWEYL